MLILASQSRYKRQQLEVLGLGARSIAPDANEALLNGETLREASARLAQLKAQIISRSHPNATVIGSDQTAHLEGETEILRKPGGFERAFGQLMKCSGRTVLFHSGICLVHPAHPPLTHIETTRVTFRQLDEDTVRRYLEKEQPWDCAGAFKCEGLGISLFERVASNDPTALVGLPLIALSRLLRQVGYPVP
ncbi:MAG: septum formation protein Maf [Gammaproteobacteria bacterium]|nr:MAG: septum formation protein Maf [Gammaproteobacteria bacterium]